MKRLIAMILTASCLKWSGGLTSGAGNVEADRYTLPQAIGLPLDQVARVVAVPGPQNGNLASFDGLFDAKRREIRVRRWPVVSVTGKQLTLTPAKYSISVSCERALGLPRSVGITIDLAAGHTYSIWCVPVGLTLPVFGIRFRDESHSEWNARMEAASEQSPE